MRLGELLRAEAYDADGTDLGQVHDVRLRHAMTPDGRHRLVVEGIIVGPGAVSARLGYAYGDVRGPWVLTRLFARLGRDARYAAWPDIDRDGRRLTVRRRRHDLPHPGEQGDD